MIQSQLEHENILKCYELFTNESTSIAYIILQYFEGKTLEELIQEKKTLSESLMKKIVTQVVSALDYLHEKGVCHRDLTASNILVNEDNEIKLIDFSVSSIYNEEKWTKSASPVIRKRSHDENKLFGLMLTNTGTSDYKAPEIILGAPYSQSVDMWSLGVIVFYGLSGRPPFRAKYLDKLHKRIAEAKIKLDTENWKEISAEAKLFIKACLTKTAFVRLSTKEALYHPWIKGIVLDAELTNPKFALQIQRVCSPQYEAGSSEYLPFSPPIKRKMDRTFFADQ